MADRAVIFDLDGTLVDTVDQHARAFADAFDEVGIHVPPDRVADEIGKGGDRVVPAVLGNVTDQAHGERLRARHGELFRQRVKRDGVGVFHHARDLLAELRRRGIATALATASNPDDLEVVLAAAGLPARQLVDAVVTDRDVDRSKPAPDAVRAAVAKLGLSPAQCAMIGDTRWDVLTARRAGVVALGVCTGPHDEARLRGAGARGVWADAGALCRELDRALAVAFPGRPLRAEQLERWMDEALAEARVNLANDRPPVGAVLCASDGAVLARARHEVAERGCTAHAALRVLDGYAGDLRDAVLVTTSEPCAMCWGAAEIAGVDAVVFGARVAHGGAARTEPRPDRPEPRAVGDVRGDACRALLARWGRDEPG